LCGMIGALIFVARGGRYSGTSAGRRAALLAVVLAAALPVLITIATRPAMYNGIRHFVFLTPPFAVLGGLAAAFIAQRLRRYGRAAIVAGAVVLVGGLISPVVEMVRLHPYEYTHFNRIIGGVAGARLFYMIDYWGLSIRQVSLQLRDAVVRQSEPPHDRTWTVAVCGPHPAAVVALGPQYSAIWDPKGADFAMMLNEFYCTKLDAPVVTEVVRDGIVYARVYDIRGRSIPSLLSARGPD
jgi:hypothetical protein